ncbi:hypothetical protein BD309DRAFT_441523 [Dichomitus squalens]|nr:hypothetical protein BD309DRAFT_441523 [Dichomitus squalens]
MHTHSSCSSSNHLSVHLITPRPSTDLATNYVSVSGLRKTSNTPRMAMSNTPQRIVAPPRLITHRARRALHAMPHSTGRLLRARTSRHTRRNATNCRRRRVFSRIPCTTSEDTHRGGRRGYPTRMIAWARRRGIQARPYKYSRSPSNTVRRLVSLRSPSTITILIPIHHTIMRSPTQTPPRPRTLAPRLPGPSTLPHLTVTIPATGPAKVVSPSSQPP